ncbi:MAG TPA: hypothetical protein VFR23_04650 [Jiangellaceae bacterium]|nr:hypothetical protein [Jiangellaceae bacterium]
MRNPAVAEWVQTCWGCPDQYEGRLADGRWFYFRYRYGWATLGLGADLGEAIGDRNRAGMDVGDNLRGVFGSDEERDEVFDQLLAWRLGGARDGA